MGLLWPGPGPDPRGAGTKKRMPFPPGSYQPSAVSCQQESILDEFYLGQEVMRSCQPVITTAQQAQARNRRQAEGLPSQQARAREAGGVG